VLACRDSELSLLHRELPCRCALGNSGAPGVESAGDGAAKCDGALSWRAGWASCPLEVASCPFGAQATFSEPIGCAPRSRRPTEADGISSAAQQVTCHVGKSPDPERELPGQDRELPSRDHELPTPDRELPNPDHELPSPDHETPNPDHELPTQEREMSGPQRELACRCELDARWCFRWVPAVTTSAGQCRPATLSRADNPDPHRTHPGHYPDCQPIVSWYLSRRATFRCSAALASGGGAGVPTDWSSAKTASTNFATSPALG
jgi:hypothetical protein